jgi:uncharacterized protein (TIGR03083 family)
MNSTVVAVADIPDISHDEAMALAEVEYARLLDAVARFEPDDWHRPTECPGWDVKDVLAHLLGMMERLGDPDEAARQNAAVGRRLQASPQAPIDAMTALQVEAHAHLGPAALIEALRAAVPKALAGRARTTAEQRAEPFDPGPPFAGRPWTRGYLLDVIQTRDPWMHRMDIARATGTAPVLTAEHDGRLVADVVAEWARRHGQPFTLVLTGTAGGAFASSEDGGGREGGDRYELDAIDFCRIVSGRGTGHGLLTQEVPF